jgi:hypothetical protein
MTIANALIFGAKPDFIFTSLDWILDDDDVSDPPHHSDALYLMDRRRVKSNASSRAVRRRRRSRRKKPREGKERLKAPHFLSALCGATALYF